MESINNNSVDVLSFKEGQKNFDSAKGQIDLIVKHENYKLNNSQPSHVRVNS